MMDIELVCPLGSECEKAVDGKVQRCRWYKKLQGQDPQSGDIVDQWDCAIAWQPILMIELNGNQIAGNESVQSLRNNIDKQQSKAIEVIKRGISTTKY